MEGNLLAIHAHVNCIPADPSPFPPDTPCQLNIPGLDCDPFGMDGQKICILHDGHQIVFGSLVQGLYCVLLPPEWTLVTLSRLDAPLTDLRGIPVRSWWFVLQSQRPPVAVEFTEGDLPYEPAISKSKY